ncbi:hypothetical protein K491DRAFT_677897 [Lophiostoma macrostomum CBS 122681]|uniref:Uncharacterized protein n=1 Tax=Lophiostoma macrostomum CBS 122681 TaxID=1314788 RepID=A0A6A6TD76_9PLEO|nr:hypothetical protein K491DRAFT_677897 [Lophiostoma macrostomum CBS 122681]
MQLISLFAVLGATLTAAIPTNAGATNGSFESGSYVDDLNNIRLLYTSDHCRSLSDSIKTYKILEKRQCSFFGNPKCHAGDDFVEPIRTVIGPQNGEFKAGELKPWGYQCRDI